MYINRGGEGHYVKLLNFCCTLAYIRYLSESWELSSSGHKLEKIRSHLVEQINLCYRFIGESYLLNLSVYHTKNSDKGLPHPISRFLINYQKNGFIQKRRKMMKYSIRWRGF